MKKGSEYYQRRMRELGGPNTKQISDLRSRKTRKRLADSNVTVDKEFEMPLAVGGVKIVSTAPKVYKSRRSHFVELVGSGAHSKNKQDLHIFDAEQSAVRAQQSAQPKTRLGRMAAALGVNGELISGAELLSSAKSRRIAERSKAWRQRNPEKWSALQNAANAMRYANQTRQCPKWADRRAIKEIYLAARKLTVSQPMAFEVDHIVPLKGKYVSGLHVHWNLRVIAADANLEKRNYWTPTQESFQGKPLEERPGGRLWDNQKGSAGEEAANG